MKNLNNYIFEKLKINKNTKTDNHDMFYVIFLGDMFDKCRKTYELSMIKSNNQGTLGFILWKVEIRNLLIQHYKLLENYPKYLNIYEIPNRYNDWEEFKKDIESFKLKIEDLNKIENDEFKKLYF